jgi:hypothetical protein
VVREGVGAQGRNDPSMYAHMNKKKDCVISKSRFTKQVDLCIPSPSESIKFLKMHTN